MHSPVSSDSMNRAKFDVFVPWIRINIRPRETKCCAKSISCFKIASALSRNASLGESQFCGSDSLAITIDSHFNGSNSSSERVNRMCLSVVRSRQKFGLTIDVINANLLPVNEFIVFTTSATTSLYK